MSQDGGSASKAMFKSLDDGVTFTVQYNPKEFRVEKSLTWEEAKTQGQSTNPIQFQKGAPMTASFDLVFDTTADTPPKNVQQVWVDALLALTNAEVKPTQGEPEELKKQRPRSLLFTWGTFSMKCVIESVNVTYLMFASSGEAVRARCSVKLKEWQTATFAGSGSSSTWDSAKIKLVDVKGGETLSQVAAANGSDMRTVATANGITDPMSDLTGQVVSIPSAASSAASNAAKSAVTSAAKAAASSAANAALAAVTSGNASSAGKAAANAATSSVTGAASKAASDALKKLF